MAMALAVRVTRTDDRAWIADAMRSHWGTVAVVSRGRLTEDASGLSGIVAERDGRPVGFALLRLDRRERQGEVVVLQSLESRSGVGTALLEGARAEAAHRGCRRLWLITTNDNLDAIRFYQRRGWDWVAFHRDALAESRRLKPSIPETGFDGIPLRHELEFAIDTR
jgi:GNAT superfamily N-acetyltransferase